MNSSTSPSPAARPPVLVFFGRHKCATRYLSNILASYGKVIGVDYLNLSIPEPRSIDWILRDLPDNLRILRATPYPSQIRALLDTHKIDFRGFHVVRDPRDMVVSAYFSHRNSHPERWIFQKAHFAALRALPTEAGLRREIDYMGWLEFDDMMAWDDTDPRIEEVKFEELTADPLPFLKRFFDAVDLPVDQSALIEILRQNSFEQLSGGRAPGEEDVNSHYRNGKPNDWPNHLSPHNHHYFLERYAGLLNKLGYAGLPDVAASDSRVA